MESSVFEIGTNFMDFVYQLHHAMGNNNINLIYEGDVNQSITMAFTALAEKQLGDTSDSRTTRKRVYHVMVECLQNIQKHADDPETGEHKSPGTGVFLVTNTPEEYIITSGNVIANKRIPLVQGIIDQIQDLEKDDLTALFKQNMRDNKLNDRGGAGLGLIDIVRKTGNMMEAHFHQLNDRASYVVFKYIVTRQAG